MGYIEKNLVEGEQVLYRARKHWIVIFRHTLLFLLLLVLLTVAKFRFAWPLANPALRYGSLGLLGITILSALHGYLHYAASAFAVTNKRVILKSGLFSSHELEIFLNKIEAIAVDSSIWAKILGYGTVVVTGTGGTKERFDHIHGAKEFQKRAENQIAQFQNPGANQS